MLALLLLLAVLLAWANVRAALLQAMPRPIPTRVILVPIPLSDSERLSRHPERRISRNMEDAEIHALFLYLRSVPPVAGPH